MSTGFSFGAKTTAPPTFGTGSITFGTPATQPPQFGFGGLATSGTTNTLGFGAPTSAPNTGFGIGSSGFGAITSTPSSGFGAITSTPATGFGAITSTPATGFGAITSTPATGFGAITSTPATGFGAPASTPGFGFGTSTASTGLSFGAPSATTGLSFGAPATSTGLSFGAPAANSGLSFGAPATSTGLSFGAPATSTGLSFGGPAVSTPGLPFGGSLSSTSTASTGLGAPAATGLSFATLPTSRAGFGAPATTSTLGFGVPPTSVAPLQFGNTSTAPTLGLNFSTSTPSLSFNTGLGGFSTSTGLGLGATPTLSQSVGLGGVAPTQSKLGVSATAQKEVPPREQALPNEFMQLVDSFKGIVQEEKNRSSEVARCCVKEFHKVENELDSLNQQLSQVENQLHTNQNLAEQLKFDTAKGLQNIEMALRTQEVPPSLQYDNSAPLQFFLELAENFERELQLLRLKIDNTAKFVKKCGEPSVLTSQDLASGMKRLHETFVALAGRMQSVHSQVEAQKELYLTIRKQTGQDHSNPFQKTKTEMMNLVMSNAMKIVLPPLATGPTPFNSIALDSNNLTLAGQQTPPPVYPTSTTGFTFGGTTASNSMFKTSGFGAPQVNSTSPANFQLQKPPSGVKRGKQYLF